MTPLPSPEDVLNQNGLTGKLKCYDSDVYERDRQDIIYAMKEYAKLILDVATERAKVETEHCDRDNNKWDEISPIYCSINEYASSCTIVDKSSILKIKDEL